MKASKPNGNKLPPPLESQIQATFVKECVIRGLSDDRWLDFYHVPNAAKRSYRLAAHLKAQGFVSGIPDIVFFVPSGQFHGLYLEFKRPIKSAKLSPEQEKMIPRIQRRGYQVVVVRSVDEAINVVQSYFSEK